jgi:hypothetical protein
MNEMTCFAAELARARRCSVAVFVEVPPHSFDADRDSFTGPVVVWVGIGWIVFVLFMACRGDQLNRLTVADVRTLQLFRC